MSGLVPPVSVVVPLFNKRAYIRRCLESIQRQTIQNFEVIVVDDGSTDGSGEIAAAWPDARFHLVRQPNGGPGAARNRGVAEARASLIAFLDADDEWDSPFLEAVLNLADQYPQAGILATGSRRLLDTGHIRGITLGKPDGGTTKLITGYFNLVQKGEFITCSSAAVPKAVLRRMGGFPQQRLGEDGELWARIAAFYPLAYDVRVLATYHSEAEGRSLNQFRTAPPYPVLVSRLRELAAQAGPAALRHDIAAYAEYKLLQYAYLLLSLGDRDGLMALLKTERFRHPAYRLEAKALRLAVPFVPGRLIRAIKVRLPRLGVYLRQARITRMVLGEQEGVSVHLYAGQSGQASR